MVQFHFLNYSVDFLQHPHSFVKKFFQTEKNIFSFPISYLHLY